MVGHFYFPNFYSFALSIFWTYFPFYTLLTVAGVSRTDDLLYAHLKTIYFLLSIGGISIYTSYCLFGQSAACRIARRYYGRRFKF